MSENPIPNRHINSFLALAGNLRFKLWAIVGNDEVQKQRISDWLTNRGYTLINVGEELSQLHDELSKENVSADEAGLKIKEWFNVQPENIILINASLLYHEVFARISPVGAFKYNARSKSAVLFLEDEKLIHNRLYYGQSGSEEFYDRDINDILITPIGEIDVDTVSSVAEPNFIYNQQDLPENAIGRLFQYTPIKDVVDIDSDLRETESQKRLVVDYIVSEGLEPQIADFFENLQKPNHKAVKIIGNYGSGKSHLLAFLISLVNQPDYRPLVKNAAIQKALDKTSRRFYTVQFEMQPVQMDLSEFFFRRIEKQIREKYSIEIPAWNEKIVDLKEHLTLIVETLKRHDPGRGLLVVVDEVSDFLQSKTAPDMKRDFQFLRIVAQVCQDQDVLLVISMQEDIYTSPKLQNVAADEDRIGQRFQTITIRREAVRQVIAQRIVPKTAQQEADIRQKLKPFADKIEDVAHNLDDYISLFPFTPSLLHLFNELPYFEKRGIIQFAQNQLKYDLAKLFPFFYTFDRIFDLLADNPNIRNLEGVYDVVRVERIIEQKILTNLEPKLHGDAFKIVKALAIYALWGKGSNGATAKELAEQLLVLPQNTAFEAQMQVSIIVKKIREATDGFYLKVVKDDKSGNDFFKFDPAVDGKDPEERIESKIVAIGGEEDKIEEELFRQLRDILDLDPWRQTPNVFEDECAWASVKSYRRGLIVFSKKNQEIPALDAAPDFVVHFISPYSKKESPHFAATQINIRLHPGKEENIEHLKRIVAIRSLIDDKVLVAVMQKKLQEALDGYRNPAGVTITGIRFRLAKLLLNHAEVDLDDKPVSLKSVLGKEPENLAEIFSELKKRLLDACFNERFPEHPKYSEQLSSANISNALTTLADEVTKGDFTRLTQRTRNFLATLNLLNPNGDPDLAANSIARRILSTVQSKGAKVTDIEKELVADLAAAPYGLEPQIVHFLLLLMTTLGKVALKAKGGGDDIDLSNIREKFRNLSQFENIPYVLKKDDISFDFAQNLLNALGLNGAQILRENTRNQAFADYKRRVREIQDELRGVNAMLEKLKNRPQTWLNRDQVKQFFEGLRDTTDWQAHDIANAAQFNKLEHLADRLPAIKSAIQALDNLKSALRDYNETLHDGLDYMKEALAILRANPGYVTDNNLISKLETLFRDSSAIVADFDRFLRRDERQPVVGKIEAFKKAYVHDFYYPAQERTIGNGVDWTTLEVFQNLPVYHRAEQLARLDCNPTERLQVKTRLWENLRNYRTRNTDIERLFQIPFNPDNNFMKEVRDYSAIERESANVDTELAAVVADFEASTIREIQTNADKIALLKASEPVKNDLKTIADSGKLPEVLRQELISAINQLFHDIEIAAFSREEIIGRLFGSNRFLTIPELHQAFQDFERELMEQYKNRDFRIRIEE